ncbi:MAG: SusC/RagA family TonB-linked outer membrane protein, partial [Candidatus Nitrosocosmicus sp.]
MLKYKIILPLFLAIFFKFNAIAQKEMITGIVTSENGSPLSGVSITVKGTSQGTATDANGKFSIPITIGQSLELSYVGFKAKELEIINHKNLTIQLESSPNNMDAVVVVGYGSQKKSDITGAISSISEKDLKKVPVTSVAQMLQGKASGVSVVNTSNKPGGGVSVLIRGKRSFNAGNEPLYVIDGIPLSSGGLNDINPSDIESIEILKDASATAIYGSRGANGVIIISSKRGKVGRTSVSYDGYYGVNEITRYADLMNGERFAEYKRESRRAIISPTTGRPLYDDANPQADEGLFEAVELESIKDGTYTDYQKLMIKKGYTQNHELSINGGSATTKFNIALGYFQDIGIIPGQDFSRYTTRFNIDQNIGKSFKVGMSTLGSFSETNGMDVNPYGQSADFGALTENPLGKAYDEDGNLIFRPTSDGLRSNPLSELVPGAVINKEKRFRLLSNIYGEADIYGGIKFRTSFSPDVIQDGEGGFHGSLTNARMGGTPSASNSENFTLAYTWDNMVTFKKQLAKHNLDFTGLYSIQTSKSESSNASVSGLPIESLQYYNMGAASVINGVGSDYSKRSILSYMARINYSYDNRFLLTLTGRADGSSKFSKENRWGYFPSAALGWNVGNENFMSNNKLFSNLKLRVSYGQTGNEGILPYQTNGLLSRTPYDFDGSAAFGYKPSSIPNKNLKWETTASLNAGIDFSIINNRISGSVEIYRSTTTDLLLPKLLPISGGFNSVLTNIGSKRNKGIELTLSSQNMISKTENGFEWSTNLNLFTNKEEILELSRGKIDDVGDLLFIGQPAVVYYDFVKSGIWQIGEEDLAKQYGSIVGGIKV